MADIRITHSPELGKHTLVSLSVIGRVWLRENFHTKDIVDTTEQVIAYCRDEELLSLKVNMRRARVGYE